MEIIVTIIIYVIVWISCSKNSHVKLMLRYIYETSLPQKIYVSQTLFRI